MQYYFYDPSRPKPTNPIVVKGMNEYHTLESRRNETKIIYDDEPEALKDGYHPYKKEYIDEKPIGTLHDNLYVINAFWLVYEKIKGEPKHLYQNKKLLEIDYP